MKPDQKEKWWDDVQRPMQDTFTQMDSDDLQVLIQRAVFKKAVQNLMEYTRNVATGMLGMTLATEEGIYQVALKQGEARGIVKAIELLVDMVREDQESEEN